MFHVNWKTETSSLASAEKSYENCSLRFIKIWRIYLKYI